jgi:Leucine-rich repeat (LRR) protein
MTCLDEKKKRLNHYFDSLARDANLKADNELNVYKNNEEFSSKINAKREAFLAEIRQCEEFNLQALQGNSKKDDQEITNEQLFTKFCFLTRKPTQRKIDRSIFQEDDESGQDEDFYAEQQLVLLDKYLSPGQIKCFKASLNRLSSEEATSDELCGLFFTSKTLVNISEKIFNYFMFFFQIMCFLLKNENCRTDFEFVPNDLTKFCNDQEMIIRLPASSGKYIGFTRLTVSNLIVTSIHSDAQFLFANLNNLTFGEPRFMMMNFRQAPFPIEALKGMIDLFLTVGSKLECIQLDLENLDRTLGQLTEFSSYPVKSVVLTSFYVEESESEYNELQIIDDKVNSNDETENENDRIEKVDNESEIDKNESHGNESEFIHEYEYQNGRVKLKKFLQEMAAHFQELTEMKISPNEIQSLDGLIFEPLSNLERLDLSLNEITSILPKSFVNASKLTHLDLSSNKFDCLAEDCFDGLVNLKSLNLSRSFDQMHPSAFDCLVSLEELDLTGLPCLSSMTVLPNWPATLKSLNLSQCSLTQIDAHSFNNIVALDKLDLSVNNLKQFELTGCAPRIIDLSRNNLDSIKFSMNNQFLARIEQLHLSRNKLSSCFQLRDLINLDVLDISNNQLKELELPKCSPRILIASRNNLTSLVITSSRLERLDLTNNNLQNSFNSMFRKDFKCFQELSLILNKIDKLEAGVFSQMRTLKKLELTNNSVNDLSADAFRGLHNLVELSLALKNCSCLKKSIFRECSALKYLELLQLDGIILFISL